MCGCSKSPSSESSEVQDNVSIATTVSKSVLTFRLLDGSSQVVELPDFVSKVDYQGIIGALSFVEKTKIALEELANIFIQTSKYLLNKEVDKIPAVFLDATINLEVTPSFYVAPSEKNKTPLYIQLPGRTLNLTFPFLVNSVIEGVNDKSKTLLSFNIASVQLLPYLFGSFTSKIQTVTMNNNTTPALAPAAEPAAEPAAASVDGAATTVSLGFLNPCIGKSKGQCSYSPVYGVCTYPCP